MSIRQHLPSGFPTIVGLIGSSRFKARFHELGAALEKQGKLVLMMSFFQHTDAVTVTTEERSILRRVDLCRLDLCDEVLVVNVGGYIGEDTSLEIIHVRHVGIPLCYLEPPA